MDHPKIFGGMMKKVETMRRWLIRCCYWYYVKGQPLIPDRTYDTALKHLEQLEKIYEGAVDPQSPTQMIWGDREDQYPEWAREWAEAAECCDE
jgi:NAD-dependent DNA ligase